MRRRNLLMTLAGATAGIPAVLQSLTAYADDPKPVAPPDGEPGYTSP